MDEMDQQQLLEQPELIRVLELYSELIVQAGEDRDNEELGTRWAQRIVELPNLEAKTLSSLHGQLIALGWLTFQLEDRNSGLMYRLTAEGKRACEWANKLSLGELESEAA